MFFESFWGAKFPPPFFSGFPPPSPPLLFSPPYRLPSSTVPDGPPPHPEGGFTPSPASPPPRLCLGGPLFSRPPPRLKKGEIPDPSFPPFSSPFSLGLLLNLPNPGGPLYEPGKARFPSPAALFLPTLFKPPPSSAFLSRPSSPLKVFAASLPHDSPFFPPGPLPLSLPGGRPPPFPPPARGHRTLNFFRRALSPARRFSIAFR